MNDVRVEGPARANFRAGRLESYAFSVEATIGQNPMRYLFARRFTDGAASAITAIFVLKPDVLFGTYVWIEESLDPASCQIHTYLPTMKKPIQVVDRLMFDCLPLTDIGYLDLMAWPHPVLQLSAADSCPPVEGRNRAEKRCYTGSSSLAGLHVAEFVTPRHGLVVTRVVSHRGRQVRRWDALELGSVGEDRLPRRVRVARLESGHHTDFTRTSGVVAVPAGGFDTPPEMLREVVEQHLSEEEG
ncbi:hypothetical protein [Streptosporangium sp. CA-115845]|uniref:hypothetical protein n=1 Tax=Streptosporangium sp. CA-115845 TaxID=3240071 RepID=UPI003D8BB510